MGQSLINQEPLSLSRGGLGSSPSGVFVVNTTGSAVQGISGANNNVLRSNGSNWEYGLKGRLVQTVISNSNIPLVVVGSAYVPTGLAGSITPIRTDSKIIVIAKINGICRTTATGFSAFRLNRDGVPIKVFGYPAMLSSLATQICASSATINAIFTPNSTSPISFSVTVSNQAGTGEITVNLGDASTTSISSMLMLEVLSS